MRRRALLAAVGSSAAALTGCADLSPVTSADGVTVTRDGCSPRHYERVSEPSDAGVAFGYEVSENSDGWQEYVTLRNDSQLPTDFSGYRVAFDESGAHAFGDPTLIPGEAVRLVTYGSPPGPGTAESCPRYGRRYDLDLDEPVLRDGATTVSLVAPDGGHVASKRLALAEE